MSLLRREYEKFSSLSSRTCKINQRLSKKCTADSSGCPSSVLRYENVKQSESRTLVALFTEAQKIVSLFAQTSHARQNERHAKAFVEQTSRRIFSRVCCCFRFSRSAIHFVARNNCLLMEGWEGYVQIDCEQLARRINKFYVWFF